MLLEQLQFLLTPAGHALLAQTAETPVTPDTHLKLSDTLGRQIGALKAQAVLETVL